MCHGGKNVGGIKEVQLWLVKTVLNMDRMFVRMKSLMSSSLGHMGSESRPEGKIIEYLPVNKSFLRSSLIYCIRMLVRLYIIISECMHELAKQITCNHLKPKEPS